MVAFISVKRSFTFRLTDKMFRVCRGDGGDAAVWFSSPDVLKKRAKEGHGQAWLTIDATKLLRCGTVRRFFRQGALADEPHH